jgi:hypothetical protein
MNSQKFTHQNQAQPLPNTSPDLKSQAYPRPKYPNVSEGEQGYGKKNGAEGDRMVIHISECRNELCPLKEVLRNHQLNGNNYNYLQGYTKEFDQQFIPFYGCPKCQHDPAKYCS